jgi:hypothetical protein
LDVQSRLLLTVHPKQPYALALIHLVAAVSPINGSAEPDLIVIAFPAIHVQGRQKHFAD